MTERDMINLVRLRLQDEGFRLWRNVVGRAWQGSVAASTPARLALICPRRIAFGVGGVGGSDLIGFRIVKGKAIFAAVEVKSDDAVLSREQGDFLWSVKAVGGVACIARIRGSDLILETLTRNWPEKKYLKLLNKLGEKNGKETREN